MGVSSDRRIGVVQTSAKKRLLDEEEMNLGSSAIIAPGLIGVPGPTTRLLDLRADSPLAQVVTVTLSQQLQNPGGSGIFPNEPIIGQLTFGNGGAESTVEFDVPPADSTGEVDKTLIPQRILRSGVSLSVPAGSLRVYAKCDRNNGLITDPTKPLGFGTESPVVYAHVAYGSVYGSVPPTRTVYMANFLAPLAPTATVTCGVPAFATGVRFMAFDGVTGISAPLNVSIVSGSGLYIYAYAVAAGSDGFAVIPGNVKNVAVTNSGANDISLAAVFEIGNF